ILTLLKAASGVDFRDYKRTTISRRIQKRLAANKIDSLEKYLSLLQKKPDELHELCREVLINVTSFFRDPEIFEALETLIFPKLGKGGPAYDTIRFWVLGCSTGKKVYPLAFSLLEFLSRRKLTFPTHLSATDKSEAALEKARSGAYPATISATVSSERLR